MAELCTASARRRPLLGAIVVVALLALAGCGSSSSSSTGNSSSSSSAVSGAPGAGATSGSVNVAAAQALVAPYTGRTGPFPVTEPLVKHPPAGSKYALLQCATPVCALFAQLFAGATKALGVQLSIVKAGPTVTAQQNAMSSIIAQKPAGVIVPGINPDTIQAQLRQLTALKVPVVSIGVVNAPKYGIGFDTSASPVASTLVGREMAAWLVLQKRASTKAVFYATPELAFSSYVQQGFDSEIKALCASCQVRNVDVPLADIGNSAPSLIVSDLQSHPGSDAAAFATEEAATGLPSALKVAGLKVTITGNAPPPDILQYIKSGQITSGFGNDLATNVWTTVDALARLSTHEHLTSSEQRIVAGTAPLLNQFLEQKDITFNPAMGWSAYPDFPARFAKLWK